MVRSPGAGRRWSVADDHQLVLVLVAEEEAQRPGEYRQATVCRLSRRRANRSRLSPRTIPLHRVTLRLVAATRVGPGPVVGGIGPLAGGGGSDSRVGSLSAVQEGSEPVGFVGCLGVFGAGEAAQRRGGDVPGGGGPDGGDPAVDEDDTRWPNGWTSACAPSAATLAGSANSAIPSRRSRAPTGATSSPRAPNCPRCCSTTNRPSPSPSSCRSPPPPPAVPSPNPPPAP